MMAVAVIAAGYWYWKKKSKVIYFAAGALFWVVAIAIKVIMDLTISQPLYAWLGAALPVDAAVLATGLYLGLRTGILENGVIYLGTLYSKLKNMSFDDAVAVGIGFGGIEALILGALSLLTVITILSQPTLYLLMPYSSQQQFEPLFMFLPVIERIFTLFCHVFATVLTIYAVKLADLKWLGIAFVFKTLLDGLLLPFEHYLSYLGTYQFFPIEAFVVIMGCIALAGVYWFGKKYGGATAAPEAGNPNPGH
ncbi:MAG TPA: YhfC family glutamic-type intramembrane protease [Methanocella sp.]|nr:YhfC family glutamic-type intramembrane protease [Methanocella sp.]